MKFPTFQLLQALGGGGGGGGTAADWSKVEIQGGALDHVLMEVGEYYFWALHCKQSPENGVSFPLLFCRVCAHECMCVCVSARAPFICMCVFVCVWGGGGGGLHLIRSTSYHVTAICALFEMNKDSVLTTHSKYDTATAIPGWAGRSSSGNIPVSIIGEAPRREL